MPAGKILLIDDEAQLRSLLSRILVLEGFEVTEAATLQQARGILQRQAIDVALCDVKLPDGNGVAFVSQFKKAHPLQQIICLTAFGAIADGVQAIKAGAFDYITKGNDNERIIPLLHQAVEKAALDKSAAVKMAARKDQTLAGIGGKSPAIKSAVALAQKLAPTEATVLLLGETGTGKEVFAHAIHNGSRRSAAPFVAINCSAFSKDLLEGELFGHKAGAFTGAAKDKKGLIETADSGTLFLDEIGELHPDLQAKLLRVLENGEFIKLGDVKTSKVSVRIIAATNRNLQTEIGEGHFREDLFYRLNTFTIELPPLRHRTEDIEPLFKMFIQQFSLTENKQPMQLSHDALQVLQQQQWKGNIRELRNVAQRAVILAEGDVILPEHLPFAAPAVAGSKDGGLSMAAMERQHIEKILQHTGGNKTKAAKMLGIGLATLYRKLEEYGLA